MGTNYEMPETLKPLKKHRKDFTCFSNLDHGNTIGHQGVPVLLSGVRPHLAVHYPEGNISVDQKIAEYEGAATRFSSMTVRVNESNFSIQLREENGRFHSFLKRDLEEFRVMDKSLMPDNIVEQLTVKQLHDLFAFLMTLE